MVPEAKFIDAPSLVMDGLLNAITGMGTRVDKNQYSSYVSRVRLDRIELESMYREDWLAAKAIDVPAKDMIREWRVWEGVDDEESNQIAQAERKLKLKAKFLQALKWSALYGGAGVVLAVEGTGEPNEPLDLNRVKKGSFKYVQVLDRYSLSVSEIVTQNPLDPNFGFPIYYMVSGQRIHHSRVLRFTGVDLPRILSSQTSYWGDSKLERIYDSIVNARTVYQSIATMVHEGSLDVLRIPDLMHLVGDCEGEKRVAKRLQSVQLAKSIHNMLLLDSQEEYEKKNTTFTGLSDLIYHYATAVAAAIDMPVTRLLGVSPGGLNATGESDLENYYTKINSDQEESLRPAFDKLDEILFRSVFGKPLPEEAQFEFKKLWSLDEKETAELNKLNSEGHVMMQDIVPESVILRAVQKEGVYEVSDDYIEEIEAMEAEATAGEESFGDPEANTSTGEEEEGFDPEFDPQEAGEAV